MKEKDTGFSRRAFAKAAALTTAAALAPLDLVAQEQKPRAGEAKPPETAAQPPEPSKLSEASQAEADLAYQTVIRKYGSRFSDEQKKEVKRLVDAQQQALDKIRAYPVTNGDQPATVLKVAAEGGR